MKHKCSFCSYQTDDIVACGKHYEMMHKQMIPRGMSGEHFAYFVKTGRKTGNCVVCKRPTKWNPNTHKYHRICSVRCARKYGEIKKLNDPRVQEEMLSHRKISGEYRWSRPDANGQTTIFTYTGSYELDFLRYMDLQKRWAAEDLIMPCPHLFNYRYDGQGRIYIPDAYIPSLDLVIEIKDGDPNNPNHHANGTAEIMRVNRVKEKLKKEAVKKSGHKYLVIYNKEYQYFEQYLRTNDIRYLTEDASDTISSVMDTIIDILDDPQKILLEILDGWKEDVSEHNLKDFCVVSSRLNDYARHAIDSEKFTNLLNGSDPDKEMVKDILYVGDGHIQLVFSIIDSDDNIKSNMGDPYIIYDTKYSDATKVLLKWKKLQTKVFTGKNLTFEFDDEDPETKRLIIDYTVPEDDD